MWLKTLYRKRAVTWPFIFYTIIWTLSTFLTPEIYSTMSEEEQNLLKRDIASFLRQMHGLDYTDISECT
ncbi:hypothetical protein, partial [Enterococcus faecium]